MKSKLMAMALAGTVMLSSAGMALANEECKWHGKNKEDKMEDFLNKVDATETQKQQLEALHKKYEGQLMPLQKTMWQQKKELMTYILSPNASESEASRRQSKMEETIEKIGRLEVQMAFEKKAILSPEQQRKAVNFLQEKTEKMAQIHDKALDDK